MEASKDLALLQDERLQVISISDRISAELSKLRIAQTLAETPEEIAALAFEHRTALAALSRAQKHLREVNISIKRMNIELQKQEHIQSKREKAARRQKAVS